MLLSCGAGLECLTAYVSPLSLLRQLPVEGYGPVGKDADCVAM
jgi:hypothetical protein